MKSDGTFTVETPPEIGMGRVWVFDMPGREILNSNITGSKTEINLSNQAPGMYRLQVTSDQLTVNKRVIIR